MRGGENPPVGLILCAQKDESVARYALEVLPNKVLAAEYHTTLPDEEVLAAELDRTHKMLKATQSVRAKGRVGNSGSCGGNPSQSKSSESGDS
jgi:hypothetical protein